MGLEGWTGLAGLRQWGMCAKTKEQPLLTTDPIHSVPQPSLATSPSPAQPSPALTFPLSLHPRAVVKHLPAPGTPWLHSNFKSACAHIRDRAEGGSQSSQSMEWFWNHSALGFGVNQAGGTILCAYVDGDLTWGGGVSSQCMAVIQFPFQTKFSTVQKRVILKNNTK